MRDHLPSVAALVASDDRLLHEELDGLAIRQQTAVVRTLMDQLERVTPRGAGSLRAQLVEELARLGCGILEAVATLSASTHPRAWHEG